MTQCRRYISHFKVYLVNIYPLQSKESTNFNIKGTEISLSLYMVERNSVYNSYLKNAEMRLEEKTHT